MKSNSLKVLSIIACIVFVFSTSCEEIDTELMNYADAEYIDIQGDLNDLMVLFQNREKYSIANDRVLSGAILKGNTIVFRARSGSEINVSEQIFNKIINHYEMLVGSGEYLLIKENGKKVVVRKNQIKNGLVRLKSATTEGAGDDRISLAPGSKFALAVLIGFRRYNGQGSLNDIWDMDSRNWGTASQNVVDASYMFGGSWVRTRLENGCATDNNCPGNYINHKESYYDHNSQTGYFLLIDNTGRPISVVAVTGREGYDRLRSYFGW